MSRIRCCDRSTLSTIALVTSILLSSTAYVLLIQGTQNDDKSFSYSFVLVLLLTTVIKALFSLIYCVWEARTKADGYNTLAKQDARRTFPIYQLDASSANAGDLSSQGAFHWSNILCALCSAALYAFNDVMVFVVMSFFESAEYTVLITGKIAIVAFLSRIVLKRVLTRVQYVACVTLTCGIVVFQYDFCNHEANKSGINGYLVVLVAETAGGAAGILNEYLLKRNEALPLSFQNLLLYLCSIVIYVPLLFLYDYRRLDGRVLGGLSPLVVLMIFVNAIRGLSISLIYKRATNMTKIFIVIPGILLTWIFSAIFLDFDFNFQAVLAAVLIFSSLYLYLIEQPAAAAAQTERPSAHYRTVSSHDSLSNNKDANSNQSDEQLSVYSIGEDLAFDDYDDEMGEIDFEDDYAQQLEMTRTTPTPLAPPSL